MRSFDSISSIYDPLTFIIFIGRIQKANLAYADDVISGSKILVLGGGTGILLPHLPERVHVDYVEPSSAMIHKARGRKSGCRVDFHNIRFEEYQTTQTYDMVICPFYLDLYTPLEIQDILKKITQLSSKETILWVSDFRRSAEQKFAPRLISKGMHIFFKWSLKLDTATLADVEQALGVSEWEPVRNQHYFMDMIFSGLYRLKKT